MAQERDTWAGWRQEGPLFSGSLFQSLPKRNDLPNVGKQFPGLMSFTDAEENEKLPLGGICFLRSPGQPAAVGTWPDAPGGTCHYLRYPQELFDMAMVSLGPTRGWQMHCGPGAADRGGGKVQMNDSTSTPAPFCPVFFFI